MRHLLIGKSTEPPSHCLDALQSRKAAANFGLALGGSISTLLPELRQDPFLVIQLTLSVWKSHTCECQGSPYPLFKNLLVLYAPTPTHQLALISSFRTAPSHSTVCSAVWSTPTYRALPPRVLSQASQPPFHSENEHTAHKPQDTQYLLLCYAMLHSFPLNALSHLHSLTSTPISNTSSYPIQQNPSFISSTSSAKKAPS